MAKLKKETTIAQDTPVASQEPLQEDLATLVSNDGENGVDAATDSQNVTLDSATELPEQNTSPNQRTIKVYGKDVPVETITLGGVGTQEGINLNLIVEKLLYVASLGGDWDRAVYPRLKNIPYGLTMILPTDKLEQYNQKEGFDSFNESFEYTKTAINAIDQNTFLDLVVKLGKQGAILDPNRHVTKAPKLAAFLLSKQPAKKDPLIKQSPIRPKYSKAQLEEMDWEGLREVGKWWDVTATQKAMLITRILKAQEV
jgi:hypothetical protein